MELSIFFSIFTNLLPIIGIDTEITERERERERVSDREKEN